MIYNKSIKLEVFNMPRYKLSPEERAAERERKENLRNIMKGLDVKSFDDLKDVFKLMVGEMLGNGLEGELDDELGYTKYDYRNKEGENTIAVLVWYFGKSGFSHLSSGYVVEYTVCNETTGETKPAHDEPVPRLSSIGGHNYYELAEIGEGHTVTVTLSISQMAGSSATNLNKFILFNSTAQ